MSTVTVPDARSAARPDPALARGTGLLYLGVGLTGMLGFLLVRPMLFEADDPAATLALLTDNTGLARTGIALELGLVVTQVLCALWFCRLFEAADPHAARATAVFGTVNAVVILASAAFLATALEAAESGLGGRDTSQLMYVLSENAWGVGAVFFGLWLIPMGRMALRSGWTPKALGWVLMAGGVGYVLSAVAKYLAPSADVLVQVLVIPATVGEFWMIGWLLVRGLRRRAAA